MSDDAHAQMVRDFHATFGSDAGQRVLGWLAQVCFASGGTWSPSPFRMAANEGRREVWLYVQQMLNLTESQVRERIQAVRRMSEEMME